MIRPGRPGRNTIALWLLFLVLALGIVSRAEFTADMSLFLPSNPTPEQQLLVDQLKSGVASRLILIGIEGGDEATRAHASTALAAKLRTDPQFLHIANGEDLGQEIDRRILLDNRYLLSDAVQAERFSVDGLRAALEDSIARLAGTSGLISKALLPRDPSGEFIHLLERVSGSQQPHSAAGVWASREGERALLLARTRAEGSDTDAQESAVAAIRAAFDPKANTKGEADSASDLRIVMTGPGPFSVTARNTIKGDVTLLSSIGMLLIVSVLWLVYRSFRAVLFGLLPVLSGALAGIAAVSLGFGTIHGATLGFGTALIGEAVDYSIYLLLQSNRNAGGGIEQVWVRRYWPTIRIGVLTSVFGFASLLFSGFPGLAQLGLYAIAGLVTAALTTRYVLPHLLPANLRIREVDQLGEQLRIVVRYLPRLRPAAFVLFAAACLVLAAQRDTLWHAELASLSPVSAADQALDMSLRADMGAPDVRYLVVATAADRETALIRSERVADSLQPLIAAGVIDSFQSPAFYLPSQASQLRRQNSLPAEAELRRRFQAAIVGLPLSENRFDAFFHDVEQSRVRAPLTRSDLEGAALAEGVDALLVKTSATWTALMPLRAATGQPLIDAGRIRAALATAGDGVYFIDLKGESDRLYAGYLQEAIVLSLLGVLAILVLLLVITRSPQRLARIMAPLLMSVTVVIAGLTLSGQQLIILHLVGMLLVVAVGSNYALFFNQDAAVGEIQPRTLASLLLANLTTVIGFGMLAFSSVPVLKAIGVTVAPGAILALLFSAILARRS